jgi:hypothetical protein
MGAALRVSRNNPAPNTKMVARSMAATTARAGWLLRVISRLLYSAVEKFCIRKKQSFGSAPNSKVPLARQEKSPGALMLGLKLGG